jgi:hypothetical protein
MEGKLVSEMSEWEHGARVATRSARRSGTAGTALRPTEIALLKSTIGDQNYLLPEDADVDEIDSVVSWCAPVRNAYTAATLEP